MSTIQPLPIRARAVSSVLLLALAGLCAAPRALAQANASPPERLTFQGFLVDGNGNPLGNTNTGPKNYDVIFRIMSDQLGGPTNWAEQQTVTVDRGNFSVLLGEGNPVPQEPRPELLSSLFATDRASDRYVEITVKGIGASGDDVTILPRLRLLTSPYAFLAKNAVTAASAASAASAAKLVDSSGGDMVAISGTNVTVKGALTANSFAGALDAANVAAGTLADARLSPNVALLNASQTFTGTNRFSSLSLGSDAPLGKLEIQAGANSDGGNDGKAIAFAWGGGGYRHWIRSRHSPTAANNAIDFSINSSPTAGGSSAPGTGSTNVMTLAGNGNVGIGTASPTSRLVVQSDGLLSNPQLVIQGASNPNKQLMVGLSTPGNFGVIQALEQGIAYRELCLNPSGGNVGIGTVNPSKGRLQVATAPSSYSGFGLLNRNGAGTSSSTVTRDVSVWGEGAIVAGSEFNALSDARIKNIQGHSDGAADLATLNRIEITDYTHKDVIAKGNRPQKKVIAQQVEKVFPQAVSQHTDAVPDIYQKAEVKDGWVKLVTNLKKGERVRLIGNKTQGIHEVLEAEQDRFRTDFAADGDTVFVYGREVNDFRAVDYDAIAMLNVSATQELAKRLEKLEQREAHLAELEQKAARVEALEREVAGLKKIVTQLAEAGRTSKTTALANPSTLPTAADAPFAGAPSIVRRDP